MYGSDRSGLSDPYAVISLNRYSSRSRVVKEDVCPTWDQTVVISNIKIFGPIQSVEQCPPPVVLEFFDEDEMVHFLDYKYFNNTCILVVNDSSYNNNTIINACALLKLTWYMVVPMRISTKFPDL